MFDISGKVVLVTGAGGYLGAAIVEGLAAAGATTLLVGRDFSKLEAVRSRLADPARCHVHSCDLTDAAAVAELVAWAAQRFSALNGLVNNAYGGRVGPVGAIEAEDFERALALNLVAPFRLSRELAPLLAAGAGMGTSAIVNIGSMYGKVSPDPAVYGTTGTDNPVHYGATKAGLIQMTRYLACNLNPARIRVNSVSPGPIPNPAINTDPTFITALACKTPMRRIGQSREVAGPVIFLLSDASSYMNGADVAVDGGWTAW